jgi:hypothetical protein
MTSIENKDKPPGFMTDMGAMGINDTEVTPAKRGAKKKKTKAGREAIKSTVPQTARTQGMDINVQSPIDKITGVSNFSQSQRHKIANSADIPLFGKGLIKEKTFAIEDSNVSPTKTNISNISPTKTINLGPKVMKNEELSGFGELLDHDVLNSPENTFLPQEHPVTKSWRKSTRDVKNFYSLKAGPRKPLYFKID